MAACTATADLTDSCPGRKRDRTEPSESAQGACNCPALASNNAERRDALQSPAKKHQHVPGARNWPSERA
eukprot:12783034-Alexandrium_andersonii.AAC.1